MTATAADDLAVHAGWLEEIELGRWTSDCARPLRFDSVSHETEERVADHLRPSDVAEALEQARAAGSEPAGEPQRLALRSRSRPFLARSSADQDRELDERHGASPAGGYESALAGLDDPDDRTALYRRWQQMEAELQSLREERAHARVEACRCVGADSPRELLAAEHPRALQPLVESFERGAIAPLDKAVAAAALDRRRAASSLLIDGEHPADSPWLEWRTGALDPSARNLIAGLLRRVGPWVGADPDAGGPRLVTDCRVEARSRLANPASGPPVILLGALGGVWGTALALARLGQAVRFGFLVETRGAAAARWSDPAFPVAVQALYRRLPFSVAFRERFGLDWPPALLAALRFQEAVAPRLGWAYLVEIMNGASEGRFSGIENVSAGETIRRATGRPATIRQLLEIAEGDPEGAAILRGTVLGLLVEERLLSRFGRDWVAAPAAHRWLRGLWEAEPEQTAESLALAADLGTIEPTPLLDGCRPMDR